MIQRGFTVSRNISRSHITVSINLLNIETRRICKRKYIKKLVFPLQYSMTVCLPIDSVHSKTRERYYCQAGLIGRKCDLPMQISALDGWLVSALSILENGSFPLLTLTLTIITSMQLEIKQASSRPPRPHHHVTLQRRPMLLPPPPPFGFKRWHYCTKSPSDVAKWKSFADESFYFK